MTWCPKRVKRIATKRGCICSYEMREGIKYGKASGAEQRLLPLLTHWISTAEMANQLGVTTSSIRRSLVILRHRDHDVKNLYGKWRI